MRDGIFSESYLIADFGISSVEPSGSASIAVNFVKGI
jgi:hypothetical protein